MTSKMSANKNYRHLRKICGVDDVKTKRIKDTYEKERRSKAGGWYGFTFT